MVNVGGHWERCRVDRKASATRRCRAHRRGTATQCLLTKGVGTGKPGQAPGGEGPQGLATRPSTRGAAAPDLSLTRRLHERLAAGRIARTTTISWPINVELLITTIGNRTYFRFLFDPRRGIDVADSTY